MTQPAWSGRFGVAEVQPSSLLTPRTIARVVRCASIAVNPIGGRAADDPLRKLDRPKEDSAQSSVPSLLRHHKFKRIPFVRADHAS